jgi:biopolymer transport protein ExbD
MAKQPIIVSINAQKQIYINKQSVTIEELEGELKKSIAGAEMPTVVLRIDQTLSVQDLVNILEIGNRLKIKMVLATNQPK